MNNEGVSSIVVVDNYFNVIGNISTTDVKVWKHGFHSNTFNLCHSFSPDPRHCRFFKTPAPTLSR